MNTLTTTKIYILSFICALFTLQIHAQSNLNALDFVENKGQWDSKVNFKGDFPNGAFFLRKTGFTMLQHHPADLTSIAERTHGKNEQAATSDFAQFKKGKGKKGNLSPVHDSMLSLRSHAYTMDFVGANPNAEVVTDKLQPGLNNYFIGDDPSGWASNCKIFQAVIYKDIYPGIDVKYYTESGNMKYEFIVHPGADASRIAMRFEGVDKLSIKNNELVINTSVGEVKELYPYTYQYDGTERKDIECRYKLEGNIVRFNIKSYSRQATLIIDPTLIFASFSGSTADNWGYTATYGPDGSFFGGGIVFDNGFPANTGAYQTRYSGSSVNESSFWNMGIIKFTPDGSQRVYATYIGGSSKDQPHSLFCDPAGNLVIGGRTTSPRFPATNANTFGTPGGWDIVVLKLNATGSGILGAVRVSGKGDDGFNTADSHNAGTEKLINNYGDDARSEVILDAANNIYLTSCTKSSDFYTTPNAAQRTFGGEQDGVLIKVDPSCNNVTYSSFFGGDNFDAGFVLALNPADGDIYVAGGTMSTNLPGDKTGVIYPTYQKGTTDGFVAVFSNDGSQLRKTTYMGTVGIDIVFGIQFDKNGFPYIMGTTNAQWPIVNAASQGLGPSTSKQFVAKLKKDLSGFVYSTVFGNGSSNPNISPVAFLVDRCENIYVSGWGKDIIGKYKLDPIIGMPITPDALKSRPDESDFYFIVIERNASKLLYGTFYGQNSGLGEHVDGGTSRFDQNGVIYQAICANCGSSQNNSKPRWPVTPGAWCCSSGYAPASGGGCNLAALKISFNFAGVGSGVRSYINSVFDTSGCIPLNITFRDTVRNAKSYEWNFGDGSAEVITDNFEISHLYNLPGTYRVRLIGIDSSSCNIRDTSYITVKVRNDQAFINYSMEKLQPCESLAYRFDNISTGPLNKPFTSRSFVWDFGDGTPRVVAGMSSITHTYAAAGTYKVRLVLADTNYCNAPDSTVKELRLSPLVKAQFETPADGCIPHKAVFKNTSLAGQTFAWDFGDGTTSTEVEPTHLYTTPGTYVVRLQVTDPATCNITDATQHTIVVHSTPTAAFSVTPLVPVENAAHTFSNNSSHDAISFKWIFGDGDSLVTSSRSTIDHQYNSTGTFDACLIAFNQYGCPDTVCTQVRTIVVPQLDVPNAFTPLGPEQASRVYVRGFAIGKMRFSVYNRLGQKIFETTDKNQGWDGRFKGMVQPMDVYAYTLEVEFTDGSRASKRGDITLIR